MFAEYASYFFWAGGISAVVGIYFLLFTSTDGPGPTEIGMRYCPWLPGGYYFYPFKFQKFVWFVLPGSKIIKIDMAAFQEEHKATAEPKIITKNGKLEGGFMVVAKINISFKTGTFILTKEDFVSFMLLVDDDPKNAMKMALSKTIKYFDGLVKEEENPALDKDRATKIEDKTSEYFKKVSRENYFSEGEMFVKIDVQDDVRETIEKAKKVMLENQITDRMTIQLKKSAKQLAKSGVVKKDKSAVVVMANQERKGVRLSDSTVRMVIEGDGETEGKKIDPNSLIIAGGIVSGKEGGSNE